MNLWGRIPHSMLLPSTFLPDVVLVVITDVLVVITDVVEGVETEVGFRFEAECGGCGYGGISSGTW